MNGPNFMPNHNLQAENDQQLTTQGTPYGKQVAIFQQNTQAAANADNNMQSAYNKYNGRSAMDF